MLWMYFWGLGCNLKVLWGETCGGNSTKSQQTAWLWCLYRAAAMQGVEGGFTVQHFTSNQCGGYLLAALNPSGLVFRNNRRSLVRKNSVSALTNLLLLSLTLVMNNNFFWKILVFAPPAEWNFNLPLACSARQCLWIDLCSKAAQGILC